MHPHERILYRFLCILVILQHIPRETQAPWIVKIHDLDEGLLFTTSRPEGHRSIDLVHALTIGLRCLPQIIPLRSRTPPPTCQLPVNPASFTSTPERALRVTKYGYFCDPGPPVTTAERLSPQEHP